MNVKELRRLLVDAFWPCTLRTSDDRQVVLRQPDMVLVGTQSLALLDREGTIVSLDPLQVAAVRELPRRRTGGVARR